MAEGMSLTKVTEAPIGWPGLGFGILRGSESCLLETFTRLWRPTVRRGGTGHPGVKPSPGPGAGAGLWEYSAQGGKGLLPHGSLLTRGVLAACQWSDMGQLGRDGMGLRLLQHLESSGPEGLAELWIPAASQSRVVSTGRGAPKGQGERTWPGGLVTGAGLYVPDCPRGPEKADNMAARS